MKLAAAFTALLLAIESVPLEAADKGIRAESVALKVGETIELTQGTGRLETLDTLPYVESEYTSRFKFDSWNNPKLAELRTRYGLEQVIAPGKDEFERQILLLDWTHHQFKKFGTPSSPAKGALQILG